VLRIVPTYHSEGDEKFSSIHDAISPFVRRKLSVLSDGHEQLRRTKVHDLITKGNAAMKTIDKRERRRTAYAWLREGGDKTCQSQNMSIDDDEEIGGSGRDGK